jgi:hypothetical protein
MQPSTAAETSAQRTSWPSFSSSYIVRTDGEPDIWPHPFFDPPPSMFVFAPPRRKQRRKRARAALSPAERADAYAGLLHGADYLDQAQDALRAGDDAAVLHALGVLAAVVKVVTGQLHQPSSENRVLQ